MCVYKYMNKQKIMAVAIVHSMCVDWSSAWQLCLFLSFLFCCLRLSCHANLCYIMCFPSVFMAICFPVLLRFIYLFGVCAVAAAAAVYFSLSLFIFFFLLPSLVFCFLFAFVFSWILFFIFILFRLFQLISSFVAFYSALLLFWGFVVVALRFCCCWRW